MTELLQRYVPLREIVRRVDAAPEELQKLGRDVLMEACLNCQAEICNTAARTCIASQLVRRRQRHNNKLEVAQRLRERRRFYIHQRRGVEE